MRRKTLTVAAFALVWSLLPSPSAQADYLGKNAAEWRKAFQTAPDARAKRNAAFALGKLGNQAFGAIPDLLQCLKSDQQDADLRETVALSLGEILPRGGADGEVMRELCRLASGNADDRVKRGAVIALGQCGTDTGEVRAALDKAMSDQSPAVRQNAAWALGEICQRTDNLPMGSLKKALADNDKLVKRDAALALGKIITYQPAGGDDASEQRERQRLVNVRAQAHPGLTELLDCVRQDYVELKKAGCGTLINLVTTKDTGAAAILAGACGHDDIEVRRNAALALANIGGKGARPAIPVLCDALRMGDSELRHLAAMGIRNVGPEAVEAVVDLVDRIVDAGETPNVRTAAAMALQNIGNCNEAVKAMPRLTGVLKDPNQPALVRVRVLAAMRVHNDGLAKYEDVFDALTKVLTEPGLGAGVPGGNLLRYDAVYLLGVFKGPNAPNEIFPVALDYLKDNSIRILDRIDTEGSGTGEPGTAQVKVKEQGKVDGRTMAIDALKRIGYERVQAHPEIIAEMRELRDTNRDIDAQLRTKVTELLKQWGVK